MHNVPLCTENVSLSQTQHATPIFVLIYSPHSGIPTICQSINNFLHESYKLNIFHRRTLRTMMIKTKPTSYYTFSLTACPRRTALHPLPPKTASKYQHIKLCNFKLLDTNGQKQKTPSKLHQEKNSSLQSQKTTAFHIFLIFFYFLTLRHHLCRTNVVTQQ